MTGITLALTTAPDASSAAQLARGLVEGKLAACVTQLPGAQSLYWWEGKIESATEILLLIKTTEEKVEEIKTFLISHHPYDTPELICLPVAAGLEKYLSWVRSAL